VTPLRRVFAHQGQIRRGRCDHSSSLTSLGEGLCLGGVDMLPATTARRRVHNRL
jgi:hypothetical protein